MWVGAHRPLLPGVHTPGTCGWRLITIGDATSGSPAGLPASHREDPPVPGEPLLRLGARDAGAGVEGGGDRCAGRARGAAHSRENPDGPGQVHGVDVRAAAELQLRDEPRVNRVPCGHLCEPGPRPDGAGGHHDHPAVSRDHRPRARARWLAALPRPRISLPGRDRLSDGRRL